MPKGRTGLFLALGALGLGVFLLSRKARAEGVTVTPGAPLIPGTPRGRPTAQPSMSRPDAENLFDIAQATGGVNELMNIAGQLYEGGHRDLGDAVNKAVDTYQQGLRCLTAAGCIGFLEQLSAMGFGTLYAILNGIKVPIIAQSPQQP